MFKFTTTNNIQKLLKNNIKANGKIGVFQDKNSRNDNFINNATLLAIHIYGSITKNIPARDPLIKPIHREKAKILKFLKNEIQMQIKNHIKNLDFNSIYKQVMEKLCFFILNDIVKGEILTNGQGQWQDLSPQTIQSKLGSSQMLIQAKKLFNSLSFKVYD
jgi:hypothetical protein